MANGLARSLHSFSKNLNDGHYPYAGLILDASGNLYGSTLTGGGTGKKTGESFLN